MLFDNSFTSGGLTKFAVFAVLMLISALVGVLVQPSWVLEELTLDVNEDERGNLYYVVEDEQALISPVPIADSQLREEQLRQHRGSLDLTEQFVYETEQIEGESRTVYKKLTAKRHWGFWSLLPALCAVLLCWITREPITALLGGIISGALILRWYDITGDVLIPTLSTTRVAGILILYLWLLGGLMGIWSRTGAAQAFAELMTRRIVRGPRTAKLVAWLLGVVFFQGGTVSTVLVGTTVKPIADEERVSHEELSYIVDSTASPIASQLAFNAWPGYVQAFIFVAGVPFLVTEADRIAFFFQSVPYCFYAIFAVLGTFLLSVEKPLFLGKKLKLAMDRARETGQLDAEDATPLAAKELQGSNVPDGYKPSVWEFFLPLGALIAIAIGTFIYESSPNVQWAFGVALVLAFGIALFKGMSLRDLLEGFSDGLKGVVIGSVILMLAITIGTISVETGGGIYMVELLGEAIPWFLLPVLLQIMTMTIAFSTGTSWGTYAVAFPLAMPLAWSVAIHQGLDHPATFLTLCFAAVMDGSVYGDQCSPISDTTVLSSVCTGCDLMDHVKTQIPQATVAAVAAGVLWTVIAYFTA